jgi:hypothetical protein
MPSIPPCGSVLRRLRVRWTGLSRARRRCPSSANNRVAFARPLPAHSQFGTPFRSVWLAARRSPGVRILLGLQPQVRKQDRHHDEPAGQQPNRRRRLGRSGPGPHQALGARYPPRRRRSGLFHPSEVQGETTIWRGCRHLFEEEVCVAHDVIDACRGLLRAGHVACPSCRRPLPSHEDMDYWRRLGHDLRRPA